MRRREIQDRFSKVANEIKAASSGLTSFDMIAVEAVQPVPADIKRLESTQRRIIADRNIVDGLSMNG